MLQDERDRVFIERVAARFRNAVRKSDLSLSITKKRTRKSDTGGFWIEVAKSKIRSQQMGIELWFDRYAQPATRRLWYGFTWRSPRALRGSIDPARIDRRYVRGWTDTRWNRKGRFHHYKFRISDSRLPLPLLEIYGSGYDCFLGRYTLRRTPSATLVSEIIFFLRQFLQPDGSFIIGDNRLIKREGKTIATETRRLVTALIFDRSAVVAQERKAQDHYICQICGFNFATVYPGLGKEFAESHHLKHLGKRKARKVRTSTKDLRTVCSNCHRMIHKAESRGRKNPFNFVRRIVRPQFFRHSETLR